MECVDPSRYGRRPHRARHDGARCARRASDIAGAPRARRRVDRGGATAGGSQAPTIAAAVVFPTLQFGLFFPLVFVVAWLLQPFSTRWKVFLLAGQLHLLRLVAVRRLSRPVLPAAHRPHGRQPGLRPHHLAGQGRRPAPAVLLAVAANLAVLIWFKYAEWIVDGLNGVREGTLPLVDVILPIGVSFFVFQAISYVVDIYRRQLRPVSAARLRHLPVVLPPPGGRADRAGEASSSRRWSAGPIRGRSTPPAPSG